MKTHINYLHALIVMILSVFFVSCNSDIFIDKNMEMPDNLVINLEGDGGYESVEYQPRRLQHIYINLFEAEKMFTFYNKEGAVVTDDCPADEISYIKYNDPFCEFSVGFGGNTISFSCLQNCTGSAVTVPLVLEYDYAVKNITVTVEPGMPMSLFWWNYDDEYTVKENVDTRTFTGTYNNGTDYPVIVYVEPYSKWPCVARVDPLEEWAENKDVDLPVPTFQLTLNDEKEWSLRDIGTITLGRYVNYDVVSAEARIPVTVPAQSSVQIYVQVFFDAATFTGNMHFVSPVYGNMHETPFTCHILEPSDFKIETRQL